MANDITCNPLIIDTAAATAIVSNVIHITNIRLVDSGNDIADGDQAILTNLAGKTVWEHRVTTPGMVGDLQTPFSPSFKVAGLICPTLTHGKVYVYYDTTRGAAKA
jgi:hypothetical protein